MPEFSDRLRLLRTSKGLSQADFAKQLKISKSSVNMYERGEREPNFKLLEKIADYFNVDMDYLLGKSEVITRITERTPTIKEDIPISDEAIQFALFGGSDEITEKMYEEVKSFAAYLKQREGYGK